MLTELAPAARDDRTVSVARACHLNGIPGLGNPFGGVVFVGVAPGRTEISTGRPYSGQAGKLFDALMRAVSLDREDYYVTNLICYSEPHPTDEQIAECWPRLADELRALHPKLIIAFGNIPTNAFMPIRHKQDRGVPVWLEQFDAYFMPTFEPAAVLYSQSADMVSDLLRDLGKIPTILNWPTDGSAQSIVHFEAVREQPRAKEILSQVPTDGTFVSVDIETTNPDTETIDAETDRLLRVGVGWTEKRGASTGFNGADGSGETERNYVFYPDAIKWYDWPKNVRWTFQYGQFDTYGLHKYLGADIEIAEDTLLMSYCLDERGGRHRLKQQAREFLGAGWYEENVDRGHLERTSDEVVDEYNAHDVAYTNRLAQRHYPLMAAENTLAVYRRLLVPGANVFRYAQEYGIKLDLDKVDELYSKWQPEQDAIRDSIQQLARDEGFQGDINIASALQLQKLFYQIIGIEPSRFTKKGAPSTDKYVMDSLDHPVAAKIRDWRTYNVVQNLLLNYLQNCKPDGRVHPRPLLHNTTSGRLAYQDPPIHGTPKAYTVGEELARVAECLAATNDDYELVVADYEQIEVWMCWAYTQDEQLHADLLSGDVHSATAEGAFNTLRTEWAPGDWQVKRQNAKKVRFGLMYGEGAEKLATPPPLGIGGTVRDCQKFIDNFWHRYRQHGAKLREWERAALQDGELVSAFGRKRRFPLVLDHRSLRQAINFPIQSTASDYSLDSAIELHPILLQLNARLLMSWHDALVIEYRKRDRDRILPIVKEIMEKPKIEGFPSVRIEMKVGPNIGQVKKVTV